MSRNYRYTAYSLYVMFVYACLCCIHKMKSRLASRGGKKGLFQNYRHINHARSACSALKLHCLLRVSALSPDAQPYVPINAEYRGLFPPVSANLSTVLAKSTRFWTKVSYLSLEHTRRLVCSKTGIHICLFLGTIIPENCKPL